MHFSLILWDFRDKIKFVNIFLTIVNSFKLGRLEVVYSIIAYELLYVLTSASIPMTVYTSAKFKDMAAIRITIQNVRTFRAQCNHFGTRFKKITSTLITNSIFIFFHIMSPL